MTSPSQPDAPDPVDALLREAAASAPRKQDMPVPPLPEDLKIRLEGFRNVGFQNSNASDALPATADTAAPGSLWRNMLSFPFLATAGACAAMILAVLFAMKEPPSGQDLMASEASLLTPGPKTGFQQPTFTWKLDQAAPVHLEVRESASGDLISTAKQAYSPFPFEHFSSPLSLQADTEYEVRILASQEADIPLASRRFVLTEDSEGRPEREPTLEGVIRQCEALIAKGRPADAWMLWADLRAEEKADPRMQALKEQILQAIS